MFLMLPESTHQQTQSPKPAEAPQERQPPTDTKFRRRLSNLWQRRWVKRGAVVSVIALCVLASHRPRLPNSTGSIAACVHVGMPYDDAISALRELERGSGTFLNMSGQTHDGREFSGYSASAFDNLPPADKVAWTKFNIMDDYSGRELYITLEPREGVTELRLESCSVWEELRFGLARGTGWSGWKSLVRKRSACFEYSVEHFFSAD
jgi:hypothetical protein